MKSIFSIILIIGCSLLCRLAFAQTIPFGYTNQKAMPVSLEKVKDADTLSYYYGTKTKSPKDKEITGIAANYELLGSLLVQTAETMQRQADTEYDSAFKKLSFSIKNVENVDNDVKALNDKRDADYKKIEMYRKKGKGYQYLARTVNQFNIAFSGKFVRNAIDAEMYYNGTVSDSKAKFLNNSLLSYSSDGGKASIFNEVYADYYGPIRVGFGVLISNKQSPDSIKTGESQKDAMQRLLGGGGNGVFSLSYPLLDYQNSNAFFIKLVAAPKAGVDIPKLGTDNNDYAVNYNLGVEGSIFYTGALKVLTFYTNFRFAQVAGNKTFYSNLGKEDKKSFGFHQLSVGVAITSTFRISYNYYFGSSYVKGNMPTSISFSIIPN